MKKSNKRLIEILLVVFVSTFIGMISGVAALYTIMNEYTKNDSSKLEEIDQMYDKILNDYYDDVDKDKLIEGAISGMLSVLDEHTTYMNKENSTSFNNKMNGEYYGIGIEALFIEDKGILVVSVSNDSPAYRSGIKENDIIVKVNDTLLKEKDSSYFTEQISKSEDELKFVVLRNDRELNISVKPEKIIIESVSTNKFVVEGKRVGYIKISIFAANTDTQFQEKLKELENSGIDSLIIDVRNNSGGYLSSAATILEMFMEKGTVLYNIESKSSITERKDTTDEHRTYPVSILVNGSSASASEVLAASFMENYNSDIIGNTTYGKGTVQEVVNVLDGTTAKITTKKWLTPNKNWINGTGIKPTITVSLQEDYNLNPTYTNDNQLQKAIEEIRIK